MSKMHVLGSVVCMTVLLATGAWAEIEGTQPGTSSNPKDNVPKEIQRSTPSGQPFGSGGTGPGSRGEVLVGEPKEKRDPLTKKELEQNAEQGGGAATAAEVLKEQSGHKTKKAMKRKHAASVDKSTTDKKTAEQLGSEPSVQGQRMINEQSMEKQQPANRPASERGAGAN